eukprot:2547827-Prymnesium_polylepis.1
MRLKRNERQRPLSASRKNTPRRVRKLEQAVFKARAQRDARSLGSAIQKLAASPAVGKRLAVTIHPDKVPAQCSDLATE